MGDSGPVGWRSGLVLFVLLIAFLLAGMKWGGGDDPAPAPVHLVCQSSGDEYNCTREAP